MRQVWFFAAATMASGLIAQSAFAQRANENAVNSAEDAFGVSVGNESVGIYSASSARGFSPVQAGNVRVDGLYWDQQGSALGRIYASTTMRVGLSAQSYPFPAPTGIVDTRLNRPADHFSGSGTVSYGPYDSAVAEVEASSPLVPGKLSAYVTFSWNHSEQDAHSTFNYGIYGGLIRWTPRDDIDIVAFHQSYNGTGEVAPVVFTAGGAPPPKYDRSIYFGQPWVVRSRHVRQMGVILSATVFDDWLLRTGFFRSHQKLPVDYVTFYRNVGTDGVGNLDVLQAPTAFDASYSGEARLSRTFTEGPRQHTLHFAVRGRKTQHLFGGGGTISFGLSQVGVLDAKPQPLTFPVSPASLDDISQVTPGLSYVGRWRNIGEFSLGAQKTFYAREVDHPGSPIARTASRPWLYNSTLAIYLGPNAVLYGSYTRGLEESGLAPENAANRGEALPASLTQQIDAGIRYKLGTGVTLLAGVFEVKKPFFERNATNIYTDVGDLSHRGIELSLSGRLAPGLTVVAGAMLLRARVEADAAVASFIAPVPVGRPNRNVRLSVQYGPDSWRGFSIDGQVSQDGPAYANRTNTVRVGANTALDIGARYVFKVFGTSASLRTRIQNITDQYGWTVASSGAYAATGARRFSVQLITDF